LRKMDIPPNQTIYVQNLNEKVKVPELKKSLYHVFSQFGNILDVFADRTLAKRGQAWIVFDDLGGSTKAMREMQGFNFYGKPMRVAFAKVKSDIISKVDGTFVARPKRKVGKSSDEERKKRKRVEAPSVPKAAPVSFTPAVEVPNNILFLENLPSEIDQNGLAALFKQYTGFVEARLIAGKPGIAFVEYGDAYQSGRAKDALQGFALDAEHSIRITFAKQ